MNDNKYNNEWMLRLHFTLVLHNESGTYQTCSYVSMNKLRCERRKVTYLNFQQTWIQVVLWKWIYSKRLRRTHQSHSLCSASRSHVLKSHQTYLQSNISFMCNHPCLWKHLNKVRIQLKVHQSQHLWLCDYNGFNDMNFNE